MDTHTAQIHFRPRRRDALVRFLLERVKHVDGNGAVFHAVTGTSISPSRVGTARKRLFLATIGTPRSNASTMSGARDHT
jgi:hypothetical protein